MSESDVPLHDGIDLHSHSHCSDGILSPARLVERAAASGARMLALTDHDTLDGLDEARTAASRLGLALVDGVEISAGWRSQSVHVLGLWIDPTHRALQQALCRQIDLRRARLSAMCAKLTRLRMPGTELEAWVHARPGVPTRTHLATAMVEAGLVPNMATAFHRYLGQGKPGHLRSQWPAMEQVVGWVRGAGGHAVLAHPLRYRLSAGARRRLVAEFATCGGAGLEVVSGSNPGQAIETAAELACTFGLAGTAGSDFHDPNLPWNPLGRLAKLPARVKPLWTSALEHS
ncbi:MAG: PHP domain-containing protein [Proteobacteria bacterium]|nr:PHP domain-containing protein [Pseudomonadota bacterium]